jgi:nitrate reductase gamma subunit
MEKILKFKHWQLFILIVLTAAWTSPSPLQEIIRFIGLITFLIWIYGIGIYGQKKLESKKLPTLKTKLFEINIVLIPILLIIGFLLSPEQTAENNQVEFNIQTILFIPISLYMFFALFQTIVFSCITLATLELKREVKFSDYLINLILTLFLIIGIWILQPKVTKLIAEND